MTTVADLITATQQHLYGMHRAEYNRLNGAINASVTSITLEFDLKGLTAGSIIAIEDELLYVWSVSTTAKTAVVQRGWQGTTAATHADDSFIEVNPRFPKTTIRRALQEEIRSWPSSLYASSTYSLSASASGVLAFNFPIAPFYNVTDLRRSTTDTHGRWARIKHYEIDRNAKTTSFASGIALYVQESLPTPCTLQASYTKPFTTSTFTDATEVETTVGLAATMVDIPPMGAAWRLLAPREIRRTFIEAQGQSRNAEDVPAGATLQTAGGLKRLRDQRITEEADRLARTTAIRW